MSVNPFDDINRRLDELTNLLNEALQRPVETREEEEFISEEELCKRFGITRPTIRKWAKQKKIPVMFFGSAKRYPWKKVLKATEK